MMNFLVITGSPKHSGLCHSITEAVIDGAREGGAEVSTIRVSGTPICRCCSEGWGICRSEHRCAFAEDGFGAFHEAVKSAEAMALISPVYWAEMAEGVKSFCDRLRRCENRLGGHSGNLADKPILLIASPGGSGRGGVTTLAQMERFCEHTNAVIFDYIIVNRWNNDYKREAAQAAAKAIASGRKPGVTL